ncbi:MAG: FadR/GntR family transcriptional regulator [Lachnospiraceae bacterium]
MQRVKLSDLAAEKIKEMIDNKAYDANGYLPSEGDLALKLEVSRATIREAVKSLEVRGLVRRIHGKGVQIADDTAEVLMRSLGDMISQDDGFMDELLEVRVMVEPKGAEFAAERRTDEDLAKLKKSLDIMETSKVMDVDYYEADLEFHLNLAIASKNRIQASLIQAYTSFLKDLIIASSQAETPLEKEFHYHRHIYDAVERQEPEAAFIAMQEHLEAAKRNKFDSLVK